MWIGRHVQVGDAELFVTGDIGHCVVTSRDPETGVTDMPEPPSMCATVSSSSTTRSCR